MCIAIYNSIKAGVISKKILRNCWNRNSHGAGYMRADRKGGIYIYKEMKDFDKFYEEYFADRVQNADLKFVLHFRIKTHGPVNEKNCHPFLVNEKVGFVHNGILSGYSANTDLSDTRQFNKEVLQTLSPLAIEKPDTRKLLEKVIGSYNKMIFLTCKNESFILNQKQGIWFESNWYSNATFKDYEAPKTTPRDYTTYDKEEWAKWRKEYNKRRKFDKFSSTKGSSAIVIPSDRQITKYGGEPFQETLKDPVWDELNSRWVEGAPSGYVNDFPEEEDRHEDRPDICSECYEGVLSSSIEKEFQVCENCLQGCGLLSSNGKKIY